MDITRAFIFKIRALFTIFENGQGMTLPSLILFAIFNFIQNEAIFYVIMFH